MKALEIDCSALKYNQFFKRKNLSLIAWCLYDWGNSAFPTLIISFIFAAYFTNVIAIDEISGTAEWGYALSISAFLVAVISPILGAIADSAGQRKFWLCVFTSLCILACSSLWYAEPSEEFIFYVLLMVGLGNLFFELCMVFYNSMLPYLSRNSEVGKLSGIGWGMGYAGGLCCLVIALLFFVQTDNPLFSLNKKEFEHLRIIGPLVALWVLIFCLPLFIFTNDEPREKIAFKLALSVGLNNLYQTLKYWKNKASIFRFLIARMIYADGLSTLFAFGGVFAAGVWGFTFEELLILGISMNIVAGFGAIFAAIFEPKIGSKNTIITSLFFLILFGLAVLIVEQKSLFWLSILGLGLFVGPVQSASRSLMAQLSPIYARAEMFGLYAVSGKATAFLGPALLSWTTVFFSSQRAGMATILVFFCVGLFLLFFVREPKP